MTRTAKSRASESTSLEKGLALFYLIARDQGQTPLKALTAELELPRSTLYRLTSMLEHAGLIARLERQHYDVGLPLAAALSTITANSQLARLCRPALRQLARDCRGTAHLGVMENEMVTYLVKENASDMPDAVFITRENTQLEAYCSGIGKVLLAWLPEAELTRYLAGGPFVALTQRTITDPAVLRAVLMNVKEAQFARDDGEIVDHIYCLSVPIRRASASVSAAISIAFSKNTERHFDEATCLAHLRRCASKLSRILEPGAQEKSKPGRSDGKPPNRHPFGA